MEGRLFGIAVAVGLAALGAVGVVQATAPSRLERRAAAAGLATVRLEVREMG